jgi:electron transport complex protein RnfC
MFRHRYGNFTGGIDLPDQKRKTLSAPISALMVPSHLYVPFSYGQTGIAVPLVRPGQHVRTGQIIGTGDGYRIADVVAPLSGRVEEITDAAVAGPEGFVSVDAFKIGSLRGDPPADEAPLGVNWLRLSVEELEQFIHRGSICLCRHPMVALRAWIDRARRHDVSLVVLNAMENQPYLTADHRMLVEHGRDVLCGLAIISKLIGARRTAMAVEQPRAEGYRHLADSAAAMGVELLALPHKYPAGADPILLKIITGREIPMGQQAVDIGAVVVDPATALAVAQWVLQGRRQATRVITVAGPQIRQPGNRLVPLGTPVSELSELPGIPLTHGGPMNGLNCPPRAIVSPATEAILALAYQDHSSPGPCIRCGFCSDHCPSRINVAAVNEAFELVDPPLGRSAGALACVDCGVCSYVCPARLPLTHRVREVKKVLMRRRTLVDPDNPPPVPSEADA